MNPVSSPQPRQNADLAFSRVDLLGVIAVTTLLALVLTPAFARTRVNDRSFQCLNNLRQLLNTWRMYAEDNSGKIPSAWGSAAQWVTGSLSWTGNPTSDGQNPSNWDINQDIVKSPLWSYCGRTPAIWRCPADPSTAIPPSGPSLGQLLPRVRSVSMNAWFNGADVDSFGQGYLKYKKLTDVLNPGPARTFVFLDERCDSINDGEFIVSMNGFPANPAQWGIVDYPANYHNGGADLAFADGHSETHLWKDRRTMPPLGNLSLNIASPNNPDVYWLMDHCTRKP
jgi:prepilin-type processing-associated H-X9-DG protein